MEDMSHQRWTKEEIEQLQGDLDIEPRDLAGALGVNQRSAERWLAGGTFPQHEARNRLDELAALRDHLYRTVRTPKAARTWMYTDNRYLGLVKPVEILRAGRIDRVNAALEGFDAGNFV